QKVHMRSVVIFALALAGAACEKTSGQAATGGAAAGGRGGRGGRGAAGATQTTAGQRIPGQRGVDVSGTVPPPGLGEVHSRGGGRRSRRGRGRRTRRARRGRRHTAHGRAAHLGAA